jgi:hypothetical protein
MNRRGLVSINRMGAGHSSWSKVKQITFVSTADCGCGDWLQTEKHIFWDCKPHEVQRATMMDILSENSKQEYPKSVTELWRLEEKDLCQASFAS